jgi:hypothetical protein
MYDKIEEDVKALNPFLPKDLQAVFAGVKEGKPSAWIEKRGIFGLGVFTPEVARIEFKPGQGIISIRVGDDYRDLIPTIEEAVKAFNNKFDREIDVF